MALTFIGSEAFPTYLALPSDITSGCPLDGANLIGKTVYASGSAPAWYIIGADLALQPFKFPPVV